MKVRLLLCAAAGLVGMVAWGQLRITSFDSSGDLTWTNFAKMGAYRVEWARLPVGPWRPFETLTNLNFIWAGTNFVTVQIPPTNPAAFYRVLWMSPDLIGVWDYHGYDSLENQVITGQLTIASTSVLSTDPARPFYGVQGSWNLQYAGPPTNQLWYLGPQIGSDSLAGPLDVSYARLGLSWPPYVNDDNIQMYGVLLPDSYNGTWVHWTWVGPQLGPFSATRR